MVTLAQRLGTTTHLSPLLRKARRLGLASVDDLVALAVARGCNYYGTKSAPASPKVGRGEFSDEELAVALLHPGLPHDPQRLRVGAAMLGAENLSPARLVRLARMERTERVMREIAGAGHRFEPHNGFWTELLGLLPAVPPCPPGVLPHPTRYVAMTGFTRHGRETVALWVRPCAKGSCG